ncbi:MAG: hypothetical protein EOP83_08920 [Verrucomicrobiaceae bacterium]|nr:MAG: hypothetical protein EOP83_08920 [Verrucomicrobiaceae bacterium]
MISNRPLPWLAVSLFACTGLVSCDRTNKADIEATQLKLTDKEAEIEDLKIEIGKLKASGEEAKKTEQKADATLQELNDSKQEIKTLKEEAEQLRKEKEKLQDQITAKIRNKAVGEKFARVAAPNGKVYLQVVIRKVDDAGVSIAHDGGFSLLNEDSAPATWVERFRLGAPKPEEPDDAALAAAAAAENGGKPQKFAAVRSKLPGVLFIESGRTKGIAFVANRDGSTWLYTAAHLLATGASLAVKDSKGIPFADLGKCEIAEDGDLARIEVSVKPEMALTVVKPGGVAADQDIVAVGGGGSSANPPLFGGKIDALKPKEIDVPSAITGGNSGGPVMLADTAEVIGVVCRAEMGRQDLWSPALDVAKARRMAMRIDREIPWRGVTLESLRTETQRIASFDSRSRLILAVSSLRPAQDGLQLDTQVGSGKGRQTIMTIFKQHSNLGPVQQLVQMDKQLTEKALRSSERDMKRRVSGIYRDLLNAANNDTGGFRPADFSYINRKEAELSVKWRQQAIEMLGASAAALNR